MSSIKFAATAGTVVLLAWMPQTSVAQCKSNSGHAVAQSGCAAQQPYTATPGGTPQRGPTVMDHYPVAYQPGRHGYHAHDYTHYDNIPPSPEAYSHTARRPHYPYLHAPLYPVPQPNIPYQVGGTVVTNQAFGPHEMLYPHSYHAMYPPFSYKVDGHWLLTPFGVWSADHWKLQGTEVRVNYKPNISLLSGFFPPSGR